MTTNDDADMFAVFFDDDDAKKRKELSFGKFHVIMGWSALCVGVITLVFYIAFPTTFDPAVYFWFQLVSCYFSLSAIVHKPNSYAKLAANKVWLLTSGWGFVVLIFFAVLKAPILFVQIIQGAGVAVQGLSLLLSI
jgi:hypothetical protein